MIFGIMDHDVASGACYGLAIETSCSLGSVGLGCDGRLMGQLTFTGPRKHAVEFLVMVDTLCREHGIAPHQIAEVYVSYGPGSFTGLRMGVTAARTLAFALNARTVPVPTLEVIAQNALDLPDSPATAAVILDAKRKRVYASAFVRQNGQFIPCCEPAEVEPAGFLARQPKGTIVLGEGVLAYGDVVKTSGLAMAPEAAHTPQAGVVYRLGHQLARHGAFTARRDLVPLYIRPPEAEERWQARHGG